MRPRYFFFCSCVAESSTGAMASPLASPAAMVAREIAANSVRKPKRTCVNARATKRRLFGDDGRRQHAQAKAAVLFRNVRVQQPARRVQEATHENNSVSCCWTTVAHPSACCFLRISHGYSPVLSWCAAAGMMCSLANCARVCCHRTVKLSRARDRRQPCAPRPDTRAVRASVRTKCRRPAPSWRSRLQTHGAASTSRQRFVQQSTFNTRDDVECGATCATLGHCIATTASPPRRLVTVVDDGDSLDCRRNAARRSIARVVCNKSDESVESVDDDDDDDDKGAKQQGINDDCNENNKEGGNSCRC